MSTITDLWKKMFNETEIVSLKQQSMQAEQRKVSGGMYVSHIENEPAIPVMTISWVRREEPVVKPKVRFINREIAVL